MLKSVCHDIHREFIHGFKNIIQPVSVSDCRFPCELFVLLINLCAHGGFLVSETGLFLSLAFFNISSTDSVKWEVRAHSYNNFESRTDGRQCEEFITYFFVHAQIMHNCFFHSSFELYS